MLLIFFKLLQKRIICPEEIRWFEERKTKQLVWYCTETAQLDQLDKPWSLLTRETIDETVVNANQLASLRETYVFTHDRQDELQKSRYNRAPEREAISRPGLAAPAASGHRCFVPSCSYLADAQCCNADCKMWTCLQHGPDHNKHESFATDVVKEAYRQYLAKVGAPPQAASAQTRGRPGHAAAAVMDARSIEGCKATLLACGYSADAIDVLNDDLKMLQQEVKAAKSVQRDTQRQAQLELSSLNTSGRGGRGSRGGDGRSGRGTTVRPQAGPGLLVPVSNEPTIQPGVSLARNSLLVAPGGASARGGGGGGGRGRHGGRGRARGDRGRGGLASSSTNGRTSEHGGGENSAEHEQPEGPDSEMSHGHRNKRHRQSEPASTVAAGIPLGITSGNGGIGGNNGAAQLQLLMQSFTAEQRTALAVIMLQPSVQVPGPLQAPIPPNPPKAAVSYDEENYSSDQDSDAASR